MPYRHISVIRNDSKFIDSVIEKLDEYERNSNEYNESLFSLIDRFRNATYQTSTLLTDRIIRYRYDDANASIIDYYDVLDNFCKDYNLSKISENLNLSTIPIYSTLKKFFIQHTHKNIGVSLSGGVDSMVILYILKILVDEKFIRSVSALHLSYQSDLISSNKESEQSLKMIGMYCSLLNIPLFSRKIEYCREKTDRNFYEEETKNVRFATYKYVSEKYNYDLM